MQKMLTISSIHFFSYEDKQTILYNDELDTLNEYLADGWKVVNMQESSAINENGVIFHLCYVVIEKD